MGKDLLQSSLCGRHRKCMMDIKSWFSEHGIVLLLLSDHNETAAAATRHSPTVKSVCSHSNCRFCLRVVQQCPIAGRGFWWRKCVSGFFFPPDVAPNNVIYNLFGITVMINVSFRFCPSIVVNHLVGIRAMIEIIDLHLLWTHELG